MGSRTGRGAGFCNGNDAPGFANAGGRGFGGGGFGGGGFGGGGFGRGFGGGGRGYRNMYMATGQPGWMRYGAPVAPVAAQPQDEKQWLRDQAEALQSELKAIEVRLAQFSEPNE
jgi:hypothetical protein